MCGCRYVRVHAGFACMLPACLPACLPVCRSPRDTELTSSSGLCPRDYEASPKPKSSTISGMPQRFGQRSNLRQQAQKHKDEKDGPELVLPV